MVTCNNQAADWPGVVHGHSKVDLPFPCRHLHGPDKCGSIAGNGHGAGDPPTDNKHRVPEHDHADIVREILVANKKHTKEQKT